MKILTLSLRFMGTLALYIPLLISAILYGAISGIHKDLRKIPIIGLITWVIREILWWLRLLILLGMKFLVPLASKSEIGNAIIKHNLSIN